MKLNAVPPQQKRQANTLDLLDAAIEAVNLAKGVSSPTPAKAIFGAVSILLTAIRVRLLGYGFTRIRNSMSNKTDYVELGLTCAEICGVLKRGTDGKKTDDLCQPVRGAIEQLAM